MIQVLVYVFILSWMAIGDVAVAQTPYATPQLVTLNITACLIAHNAKRALHCVPDLQWDNSLVPGAEAWALHHARKSRVGIEHSKGNGGTFRENIYYKFMSPVGTLGTCEDAVQWWYDEIRFYDYKRPGYSLHSSRFTQLIWKTSTKVGVAMAASTRGPYTYTFVVAHYAPAGNVRGTFASNVPDLQCRVAQTPYATPQLVTLDKTACLNAHNAKRALHCVPDLQWDDSLVPGAEAWALHHARKSRVGMEHSKGNGGTFRENIYYKFMSPVGTLGTCEDAVQWWYDEIRFYDYKRPGYSLPSSHFTQLIWKTSTKVGVAMAASTRGPYTYTFVVAHYAPAGNVRGTFASNVPDLQCRAAPVPYLTPQIYTFTPTDCLNAHNTKRALHGVPNLRWDASMASDAANWALRLARDPLLRVRSSGGNGRNYRENIYYRYAAPPGTVTSCAFSVQKWYDEMKYYDFNTPGFRRKAAHFTQLIWKGSTRVGVGIAVVTRKKYTYTFIVARYAPAGNIFGTFAANVPNLLSKGLCRKCKTDAVPYSTPTALKFNIADCLRVHNAKRALHGVPNLRWDASLASGAARWALKLAKKRKVRMRASRGNGRRYRENSFYKFTSPPGTVASCADGVQWWYSQIKHYNFNRPSFRSKAQHFTQLIWRSSTKLGVGIAAVSRRGYTYTFIVARFSPAGNIYGRFAYNVPRSI